MKTFYLSLSLLSLSIFSSAQSYYYKLSYGTEAAYVWSTYGYPVLSSSTGNKNDVLSTAQPLPFSWSFDGDAVTHYKVSDNGYITFDTASTTSYPSNTSLPNASAPNRSIFAFWDDFELKSFSTLHDNIYTWTYGSAPNRVHVIQWSGVTPRNQSAQTNNAYFAIRIYETGDFDVVYNFRNSVSLTGTTGVEDSSGTTGVMVTGSPGINLPSAPVLEQNRPVYTFIYGTQPQRDICGLKHSLPEIASSGNNVTIGGTVMNYGSQTVTSLRLNYSVNGGIVQSHKITGINIANNASYTFTHATMWTATGAGNFQTIQIWADSINGGNDSNNPNDTITALIFINNGTAASKKVLIEEYSTAPCGYCPNGSYVMDTILLNHNDILGVTHHAGYQTDSMTISESLTLATEFAPGAPYAAFNRVHWPGEVYPSSSDRTIWSSRAVSQLNVPSPVNVTIATTWNSTSRQLDITAYATFVDYAYPGDIRISVFVIEDSVIGSGTGYNQTNYYNTTSGSPFFGLGNPIIGYAHRHVLRAVPSGAWGTAGVIATAPTPGQNYSKNYNYTAPASYNENKMSVIAFINYYDASGRREILNAEEKHNIAVGINETNYNISNLSLYPNPASGLTAVKFNLTQQESITINIINTIGEVVLSSGNATYAQGNHSYYVDTNALPSGIYTVNITSAEGNISKKLIVVK